MKHTGWRTVCLVCRYRNVNDIFGVIFVRTGKFVIWSKEVVIFQEFCKFCVIHGSSELLKYSVYLAYSKFLSIDLFKKKCTWNLRVLEKILNFQLTILTSLSPSKIRTKSRVLTLQNPPISFWINEVCLVIFTWIGTPYTPDTEWMGDTKALLAGASLPHITSASILHSDIRHIPNCVLSTLDPPLLRFFWL